MIDLRCPACRHPVDVPDDHVESTINCGICWAEVSLGDRMVPVALEAAPVALMAAKLDLEDDVEITPPPKLNSISDPFAGIVGRPVKGHAALEDILRRVVEQVPAFLISNAAKPSRVDSIIPADLAAKLPPVPQAVPTLPSIETRKTRNDSRRDEDDLRRPRRPVVNPRALVEADEDDDREDENEPSPQSNTASQIAVILGFLFMAALAFYVVTTLMK